MNTGSSRDSATERQQAAVALRQMSRLARDLRQDEKNDRRVARRIALVLVGMFALCLLGVLLAPEAAREFLRSLAALTR